MGYPPGPPVPDEIAGLTGPPPGQPPSIPIGGGGPGGPPPDMGGGPGGPGGLPPELMAALAGGGGPPDQGGGGGMSDDPVELLGTAIDALSHYIDVEQDDIDKQTIMKALATIQGVRAKDQKEAEAAQGTTPAIKGMAKAISR